MVELIFLTKGGITMNKKPNIIFMICHDLGQHLNCYGIDTVSSPNIDRLAAEGVKFENSFCTAPHCSPSRASVITGRYPHSNGVVGLAHGAFKSFLKEDERPLTVLLKEEGGYETYSFGVEHATSDVSVLKYTKTFRCGPENMQKPDCRDIVTNFEKFIIERNSEAPFFAQLGFFEPHHPYEHGGVHPDYERGVKAPAYMADSDKVTIHELAMYQGAIRKLDASVGDILRVIEENLDMENTWVIFTTDHGSAFPRAKLTLFDAGINTALIMKYKGESIQGGKVYEECISNVDILPTILEKLGIQIPDKVQGNSFWKLLNGQEYEKQTEIFSEMTYHETYKPMRSIRTKHYKLIVNFEVTKGFEKSIELYDLKKDPLERNNIADIPENQEIVKQLARRLHEWMLQTEDPLLDGPIPSCAFIERMNKFKSL